ncbi:MAG: DUF4893 domain-containing protein [Sphingomonas sp.]
MTLCVVLAGMGSAACAGNGQRTAAGSGAEPGPMAAIGKVPADWRKVATLEDRGRLRNWRATWIDALKRARNSGAQAAIAAQGALFDPDRALGGPVPPAGHYRCHVYKLGANGTAMANYTAYEASDCEITDEGRVAGFSMKGGSQRPVGALFRQSDTRAVFLGTLVIGDETKQMRYGRDAARNIVGYIERIGEARWRLVEPAPAFESRLNIIELTPAPAK